MKKAFFLLTLAALLFSMSSCSTYVDGTGYVAARPGYPRYRYVPPPRAYPHSYSSSHTHHYYDDHHPTYYKSKRVPPGQWKRSGVNARVNSNVGVRPLNLSTSTGIGLF